LILSSNVKLLPSGLFFVVLTMKLALFISRYLLTHGVMLAGFKNSSVDGSKILGKFSYHLQLKTRIESIFERLWAYLKVRTLDKFHLITPKGFEISPYIYISVLIFIVSNVPKMSVTWINFTFTGPVQRNIISIVKPTRCTSVSNFILEWYSTCFGRSFLPSSGVQDCTYSNSHLSNRYCCLLANKQSEVSVWHMPVAVCTVFNSWWWTERPPETCRVSFQNKIWYIGASSWSYYR